MIALQPGDQSATDRSPSRRSFQSQSVDETSWRPVGDSATFRKPLQPVKDRNQPRLVFFACSKIDLDWRRLGDLVAYLTSPSHMFWSRRDRGAIASYVGRGL